MGMIHAKCEQCWDVIPCHCPEQRERERAALAWREHENRRIREREDELHRREVEALEKIAARLTKAKD